MNNNLKYVRTVYEKGSFSKAAQALYITQPALSLAISKLEGEIGLPLFDRSQKPVELTEAGHIYLEKAEEIEALEREMNNQLSDLRSLHSGHLCIGVTGYLISFILPIVLHDFRKAYPGIELKIAEAGSYELKNLLLQKKVDLIFLSDTESFSEYRCIPVFQDHLLLALSKEHPIHEGLESLAFTSEDIVKGCHLHSQRENVDLRCFRDVPFLLLEPKYNLRRRTDSFFEESGFLPRISMEATQMLSCYSLAKAGMGAAFIPDRMVSAGDHDILFYKIGLDQATRSMNLVMDKSRYVSLAIQHFTKMLTAYFKEDTQE